MKKYFVASTALISFVATLSFVFLPHTIFHDIYNHFDFRRRPADFNRAVLILDLGITTYINKKEDACLISLNYWIKHAVAPIIVSTPVAAQYFTQYSVLSSDKKNILDNWRIFFKNNFVILIPNKYLKLKNSQFDLQAATGFDLTNNDGTEIKTVAELDTKIVSQQIGSYKALTHALGSIIGFGGSIDHNELKKLFLPKEKNGRFWNIYIIGHGNYSGLKHVNKDTIDPQAQLAGLNPEQIFNFLTFLYSKMHTNSIVLMTCYGNGHHAKKISDYLGNLEKNSLGNPYSFILKGASNATVYVDSRDCLACYFDEFEKKLPQTDTAIQLAVRNYLSSIDEWSHIDTTPILRLPRGKQFNVIENNKKPTLALYSEGSNFDGSQKLVIVRNTRKMILAENTGKLNDDCFPRLILAKEGNNHYKLTRNSSYPLNDKLDTILGLILQTSNPYYCAVSVENIACLNYEKSGIQATSKVIKLSELHFYQHLMKNKHPQAACCIDSDYYHIKINFSEVKGQPQIEGAWKKIDQKAFDAFVHQLPEGK